MGSPWGINTKEQRGKGTKEEKNAFSLLLVYYCVCLVDCKTFFETNVLIIYEMQGFSVVVFSLSFLRRQESILVECEDGFPPARE
ncbi:MAG: hypothetical protein DWQ04_35070 [Chloroflexi bacterium]|nr:MAG: hypothetical protein DWQ04_35070 [Chloroflexota bacterium]